MPNRHENMVPPQWPMRLLQIFCPRALYEEIEGDLIERFHADVKKYGESAGRRRLAWNVIRFLRPGIVLRNKVSININYLPMFSNYFRVALRNAMRNKTFSAINITGLATGIVSVALISGARCTFLVLFP